MNKGYAPFFQREKARLLVKHIFFVIEIILKVCVLIKFISKCLSIKHKCVYVKLIPTLFTIYLQLKNGSNSSYH